MYTSSTEFGSMPGGVMGRSRAGTWTVVVGSWPIFSICSRVRPRKPLSLIRDHASSEASLLSCRKRDPGNDWGWVMFNCACQLGVKLSRNGAFLWC